MELTVGETFRLAEQAPTRFDHGVFEPRSGLVFVAHTAEDQVLVVDPDRHAVVEKWPGHPAAAGVAAASGLVAITNRGDDTLSIREADGGRELVRTAVGRRPNGVALSASGAVAVVCTLGRESVRPTVVVVGVRDGRATVHEAPGPTRWVVMDPDEKRAFCAISSPSAIAVVDLVADEMEAAWHVPALAAHGIDADWSRRRLFVACDAGALIELDADSGVVCDRWLLPGVPDATWFNSGSGLVHVAIASPGLVATVDPAVPGRVVQTPTGPGAKTTALVPPDRLLAFLPEAGEALELFERP